MFKLLTEEGLEKVRGEYNRRRAAVVLAALILVLVVAIVGILPSYVLSTIREREVEDRTRIIAGIKEKGDEKELEKWFIETNLVLHAISPELDMDRPSNLIDKVLEEKIVGVRLTSFLWKKKEGSPSLLVKGTASNRQSLIAFRDSLNERGDFASVDLPISDLALDKDIDFQMTLKLK